MREVIFKHLTSAQSRKKDILLKEVFEKDGMTARTERRCFYYIKEITPITSNEDVEKVMKDQDMRNVSSKRHFYIMKEHSDIHGEDKVLCKIAGTFYVIVNNTIFTIAFLHAFRVRFAKAPLAS